VAVGERGLQAALLRLLQQGLVVMEFTK